MLHIRECDHDDAHLCCNAGPDGPCGCDCHDLPQDPLPLPMRRTVMRALALGDDKPLREILDTYPQYGAAVRGEVHRFVTLHEIPGTGYYQPYAL